MYNTIIVKYGEIGVKGKNRYLFENKLIKNTKNMLKPIGDFKVYKEYGRIYVDLGEFKEDYEEILEEVKKVFGVVGVCPAVRAEKDYEKLKEIALELLEEKIEEGAKSFKVASRRGDKNFKFTSQANHMSKLLALKKDYEREGLHLQRLYKRRKLNADGTYSSNWSSLRSKSVFN